MRNQSEEERGSKNGGKEGRRRIRKRRGADGPPDEKIRNIYARYY